MCIPSPAHMRVCEMYVHSRRAVMRTSGLITNSVPSSKFGSKYSGDTVARVRQYAPPKAHVTKDSHIIPHVCVLL